MKFDLYEPCSNCPFLKKGGIRLTQSRVRDIAGMMLDSQGGMFPCHKTTIDDDGDSQATPNSRHCAGALAFMEKNQTATQIVRIMERLGSYDAAKITGKPEVLDAVFDTMEDMLVAQKD